MQALVDDVRTFFEKRSEEAVVLKDYLGKLKESQNMTKCDLYQE